MESTWLCRARLAIHEVLLLLLHCRPLAVPQRFQTADDHLITGGNAFQNFNFICQKLADLHPAPGKFPVGKNKDMLRTVAFPDGSYLLFSPAMTGFDSSKNCKANRAREKTTSCEDFPTALIVLRQP